jgi:hypothetical protein
LEDATKLPSSIKQFPDTELTILCGCAPITHHLAQGVGNGVSRHVDVPGIAGPDRDNGVVEGMLMSRGFRLTLQLIATLATAAAVARATESARRAFTQAAVDPPRHRATTGHAAVTTTPAGPKHLDIGDQVAPVPSTPHPFGPARAIPCRGVELPTAEVIELEASGELDGAPSPTERLLARRHAAEAG